VTLQLRSMGATHVSATFYSYMKDIAVNVLSSLSLSMALQPFGPWPLFQFLNPIHGTTPWTGDQPVARPLPIGRKT
jgi:hypothetical protein